MAHTALWGEGASAREKSQVLRWEHPWNEKENIREMIASGQKVGGREKQDTRSERGEEGSGTRSCQPQ